MKPRQLTGSDLCEGYKCTRKADFIVHDRVKDKVILLCSICEDALSSQACSEYDIVCPNCGCTSYVN